MGNRGGRLHDPAHKTLTGRQWASRRWIICVLDFKNRQREVMGHSYTELFFLDEATALAAGHRPCYECRRPDANAFAASWAKAFNLTRRPSADEIDLILHQERLSAPISDVDPATLPVGAMIAVNDEAYLRVADGFRRWSFDGYGAPQSSVPDGAVLLTPPSTLAVLNAGYAPSTGW